MARQQVKPAHRSTPQKTHKHTKRPLKSALKAPTRSPLATLRLTALNRVHKPVPNTYQRFTNANPKTRLAAIREESASPEPLADLFRDTEDDAICEKHEFDSDGDDDDDELDEMAEWDETTLVAMLHDESSEQSSRQELMSLAQSLQTPMSAQSAVLKEYLASTLIPATKRVKEVHETLEENVDVAFGAGLLVFNQACKQFESMAMKDEDELKTAYDQSTLADLYNQLQEAYGRRDKLWDDLQEAVDASVERTTAALNSLPDDLDRKILLIEKKSKEFEKDDGGSAKEKILRGLLGKL